MYFADDENLNENLSSKVKICQSLWGFLRFIILIINKVHFPKYPRVKIINVSYLWKHLCSKKITSIHIFKSYT